MAGSAEKCRAVLDIRSSIDDTALAVHPSQCLFMPAEEVVDRFVELPIKGTTELYCLHDPAASKPALDLLMAPEGYKEDIRLFDVNDARTWDVLREEGFLVLNAAEVKEKMQDRALTLHLWRPSPMMASVVEALVSNWGGILAGGPSSTPSASVSPPAEKLWILDAGAGKGRNAVYLAQELDKRAGSSSATSVGIVALEIRRIITHRAAKFFYREGFCPSSDRYRRGIATKMPAAAVSIIGACGPVEALFDPPVAVKKAPQLTAWDRFGDREGQRDSAASAVDGDAANVEVFAFPRKLGEYHAALFLRFSHNDGLVELSRQLAVADQAARTAGTKNSRPPFILAVECFHVSSPHPKQRDQKLEVGEVMSLLAAGEAKAKASTSSAVSSTRWQVILERVGDIEDGRPTLQGIYRYAWDGDDGLPLAACGKE